MHSWVAEDIRYRQVQSLADQVTSWSWARCDEHAGESCACRLVFEWVIHQPGNQIDSLDPELAFVAAFYHRVCTVQTSSMGMSTEELVALIKTCGVNRVVLYAPFLSSHIRNAKDDPELLDLLRNCKQIMHTGVTLNVDDEDWAYKNGLPISVRLRALYFLEHTNIEDRSHPTGPQRQPRS